MSCSFTLLAWGGVCCAGFVSLSPHLNCTDGASKPNRCLFELQTLCNKAREANSSKSYCMECVDSHARLLNRTDLHCAAAEFTSYCKSSVAHQSTADYECVYPY